MIREKRERGVLILSVLGSFMNERSTDRFEAAYKPHLAEKRFIVELAELDYIDSSHLAALVVLYKRVAQDGGLVVFSGLKQTVRDTLFVTRLDKVFSIATSRKEALEMIEKASTPG